MIKEPHINTYSIAAYDPENKSWGVAVASKFLGVGAFVPFAKAGIGAIATQSLTNMSFGPKGLELLSQGKNAQEVLDTLIKNDDNPDHRQVGIVDSQGNAATYTGKKCFSWAGGITGKYFSVQGNTLVGEQTISEMKMAYTNSDGDLAHKLYAALLAGDKTGGDKRGKQSAALVVVKEKAGYGGYSDRYLDLRVDDHKTPVEELGNLLKLHGLFLGSTPKDQRIKIDTELTRQIQKTLKQLNYYSGEENGIWNEQIQKAFEEFAGIENLEERVDTVDGFIDPPALEFIKERFFNK